MIFRMNDSMKRMSFFSPSLFFQNCEAKNGPAKKLISAAATTFPKRICDGNNYDSLTIKQYIRVPQISRCTMVCTQHMHAGQKQLFTKPHKEIRCCGIIATVGLTCKTLLMANVAAILVLKGGNFRQRNLRLLFGSTARCHLNARNTSSIRSPTGGGKSAICFRYSQDSRSFKSGCAEFLSIIKNAYYIRNFLFIFLVQ